MAEQKPEQIHFEDELHRYARADSFTPFEIVVASGDHYLISEPMQIAFGGDTVVTVLPKSGIRFFRTYQIVSVHVLEPSK